MKKINVLLLGVCVLFAGFFGSCKKDSTGTGPDISFTNNVNSTSLTSGTSWTVTGLITSDVGLDQVKYFKTVGGAETQIGAVTSFDDKNNFNFTVTVAAITENTTVRIEATDKDNITNSLMYTITVSASAPKLSFWTGTLAAQLGASSNNTVGSSYATATNTVYLSTPAKTNAASIDFYYFYNASEGTIAAEIMSPFYAGGTGNISSVATWTTKNATKFGTTTITASNFDAITATDDTPVVNAATNLTADRVVNLTTGNVFAFQTAAGKKGLAKVTNVSTGVSGTITIEVKVQK